MLRTTLAAIALVLSGATPLHAQPPVGAFATLHDAGGEVVGEVELVAIPTGGAALFVRIDGVPSGSHAFHVHETGACEAPSFESAGGHHAPDARAHGVFSAEGRHAGDLPNLHVPADRTLMVEVFADRVSLEDGPGTVFDDDGGAFVIHVEADDYVTDPAGAAGDRIACGVIERAGE